MIGERFVELAAVAYELASALRTAIAPFITSALIGRIVGTTTWAGTMSHSFNDYKEVPTCFSRGGNGAGTHPEGTFKTKSVNGRN